LTGFLGKNRLIGLKFAIILSMDNCKHKKTVFLGWQDDGDGGKIEFRNCLNCKTTLAGKIIPAKKSKIGK